jgi:hypothetical protein
MTAVLEVYATEDQCSLARFILWAKILNSKNIAKEIFSVYGGNCLSRKAIHDWVEMFSQGRLKSADDARPFVEVAETTVK